MLAQKNSLILSFIRDKLVKNTHEWIAFKAIEALNDTVWQSFFIKHIEQVLKGSKAPDKEFKDWENHVFHPPSWGGAPEAAEKWYSKFVNLLKNGKWSDAAFAFGVLSHYIADPLHPLHTGQTEEEKKVHKFHEFGTSLSLRRYDNISVKNIEYDDIKSAIITASKEAHEYYFDVVELYDSSKGFDFHWDLGITEELHEINKRVLEKAVSLVFSALNNAIKEANVKPPKYNMTIKSFILRIKYPVYWFRKWLEKRYMKRVTKRMKKELKKRGVIYESLPPDDKGLVDFFKDLEKKGKLNMEQARKAFMRRRGVKDKELKKQEKVEKRIVKNLKFRLSMEDDVERAPEIGKKTAEKLKSIGISKVKDLIEADYERVKEVISWLKEEDLERWKIEAKLMMEIPNMRVKDVVYMYYLGIRNKEDLKNISKERLKKMLEDFKKTQEYEKLKRWLGELSEKDLEEWKEKVSQL